MTDGRGDAGPGHGRAPAAENTGKPSGPCPICGRPAHATFRPFCSQRCADVDLGRWLGERYVIPGPEGGADTGKDGLD